MKLEPLPDPWFDPENISHVNAMFYSGEPHEYFLNRLGLLVLAAGKPELVEEAVREGITYEGLKVGGQKAEPQDGEDEDDEQEAKRHRQFVIAETLALLYHVSETLVRFYLAHERLPECPWIEIAGEPPVGAFKKVVAKRFDGAPLSDDRRRALARVFYGSERPQEGRVSEEDWDASLDNIELWLDHFAEWFLDDAHVWNSVKHGLAVQLGEPSMELTTPADEAEGRDPPLIHAKGPGVTYLEKRHLEKWRDEKLWHISTRWLRPFTLAHLMGEIHMACSLLRSIWQVGRTRYLGEGQSLRIYGNPTFTDFMDTAEMGVITNRMHMNMLYVYAYPPDLVCSKCGRMRGDEEHDARRTWRMYRDDDGAPHVLCPKCAGRHEAAP